MSIILSFFQTYRFYLHLTRTRIFQAPWKGVQREWGEGCGLGPFSLPPFQGPWLKMFNTTARGLLWAWQRGSAWVGRGDVGHILRPTHTEPLSQGTRINRGTLERALHAFELEVNTPKSQFGGVSYSEAPPTLFSRKPIFSVGFVFSMKKCVKSIEPFRSSTLFDSWLFSP